jgi:NADPH-dependent 2,4-dienoyl-CoA reductase/sulfur reductase-like enzyme/rhodanese-related sulfurtransferase
MPQNIIIIGAVALGPKAACRFKRLEPDSEVIMIDEENLISYGGCGIPYFISGDVSDPDQLQSTSFNMLRNKQFFLDTKDIEVMTKTRALSIDRNKKNVLIENIENNRKRALSYDKLVLGTGSRPKKLPLPGSNLEGVFYVSNLNKAIAIKKEIAEGNVEKAVIIGAGAIGLEIAESLADLWGIETTVVEIMDQILPGVVSPNMARMCQHHMEENDVTFCLGQKVERFEGKTRIQKVITDKKTMDADLVIIAAGVTPNTDLARKAGLNISSSGAIVVNNKLQTSDPDIYAGGDCVEITNLITGKSGYWPLGSLANRQGRIIGTNLAGGNATFEGSVGSFVIKLFNISAASAGINIETAKKEGFDAVSAFVVQFDHAHFYPEKDLMYLELVAEKGTGRVLGIQGLGNADDGMVGRINAVASLLKHRITVEDISNLELPYSPPFSSAMDILNALGNTAENILAGKNRVVEADEFADWWEKKGRGDTLFLDCREWGNAQPFVERYPGIWKSIPQGELRKRLAEVPQNKRLILICNTGVRSYEAQITLDQNGIINTYNLQGGMAAVKKWGLELLGQSIG